MSNFTVSSLPILSCSSRGISWDVAADVEHQKHPKASQMKATVNHLKTTNCFKSGKPPKCKTLVFFPSAKLQGLFLHMLMFPGTHRKIAQTDDAELELELFTLSNLDLHKYLRQISRKYILTVQRHNFISDRLDAFYLELLFRYVV